MAEFKFELGAIVKSNTNSFCGTIEARTENRNGINSYTITPDAGTALAFQSTDSVNMWECDIE